MDLEHPSITRTIRTGYPVKEEAYEIDVLGNPVYLYDDVIAMPDGIYRVASLSDEDLEDKLGNGGIYQQAE